MVIIMSNLFEQTIRNAQNGEFIPAPERLALFICRSQGGGKENDEADMAERGAGGFAAGLMGMVNEDRKNATWKEAGVLFDHFITLFETKRTRRAPHRKQATQRLTKAKDSVQELSERKNPSEFLLGLLADWKKELVSAQKAMDIHIQDPDISISWHVDYGPETELADVLRAWHKSINEEREAVGDTPLPHGWGVGMKCSYIARDGCAEFRDSVIQMDGNLTKENPWKTFYDSSKSEDGDLAKLLQPRTPLKWKKKFMNRSIAWNMGYTCEDAPLLAKTNNWGVVEYLFSANEIPLKIGFEVLQIASWRKNWDMFKLMFKEGFPIADPTETYYGDTSFGCMIYKAEPQTVNDILKLELNVPSLQSNQKNSFQKNVVWDTMLLVTDTHYDVYGVNDIMKVIDGLGRLWTQMEYGVGNGIDNGVGNGIDNGVGKISDVPLFQRNRAVYEFYQRVFKDVTKRYGRTPKNNNPNTQTILDHLDEAIKKYETNQESLLQTVLKNPQFYLEACKNDLVEIKGYRNNCVVCNKTWDVKTALVGEHFLVPICKDNCFQWLKHIVNTNSKFIKVVNDKKNKGKEEEVTI